MNRALSQLLPCAGGKRLYGVRCRMTGSGSDASLGRYTSVARSTPSRIGTHSMWQVTCGEPALCASARRARVKTEPATANERATARVRAHLFIVILDFMVFPRIRSRRSLSFACFSIEYLCEDRGSHGQEALKRK